MLEVPPLLAGRYRIVDKVGEGGAATVYRCLDQRLGVICAVKVLLPQSAEARAGMRQRLQAEAKVMARLSHPHILAVTDVGREQDFDFVVMHFAAGGSLSDRLRAEGPTSPRQAVIWTLEVLSALDAAHKAGVVHRDVKPQNLLLTHDNRIQLADFGIALIDSPEFDRKTRTGVAMGSMAFMAPEQRLDASRVTPAADIYAVGATLYTLLTHRSPMDLFTADAASPRWALVPEALRPVLLGATRYEPAERIADAAAFSMLLEDALSTLSDDGIPKFVLLPTGNTAPSTSPATRAPTLAPVALAPTLGPPAPTTVLPPRLAQPSRRKEWAAGLLVLLVGGGAYFLFAAPPRAVEAPQIEDAVTPPVPVAIAPVEAPVAPTTPLPPPEEPPAAQPEAVSPAPQRERAPAPRRAAAPASPLPTNLSSEAPQNIGPAAYPLGHALPPPAGQWSLGVNGVQQVLRFALNGGQVRGTVESRMGEARHRTHIRGEWRGDTQTLALEETGLPAGEVGARYVLRLDESANVVVDGKLITSNGMVRVAGTRDTEDQW